MAAGRWYRALLVGPAVAVLLTSCGGSGSAPGAPAGQSSANPSSARQSAAVGGGRTTAGPTAVDHTGTNAGSTTPSAARMTTGDEGGAFAGEDLSAAQAAQLQDAVDAGHQPWRLDQASVASSFAQGRFGWTDVDTMTVDPHTIEVTDRASGQRVVLQLRQPVRSGPDGVWIVVSGARVG